MLKLGVNLMGELDEKTSPLIVAKRNRPGYVHFYVSTAPKALSEGKIHHVSD